MWIKRNDVVKVISGDDKGKTGKVLRVEPDTGLIVVEGVNQVWEHVRRSQKHPKGGRIRTEAALSASKVMVICQSCNKPTRIKVGYTEDPNEPKKSRRKTRLCRKCGKPIKPEEGK